MFIINRDMDNEWNSARFPNIIISPATRALLLSSLYSHRDFFLVPVSSIPPGRSAFQPSARGQPLN